MEKYHGPWGPKDLKTDDQSGDEEAPRNHSPGRIKYRIIDWYRAIVLTVLSLFAIPLVVAIAHYNKFDPGLVFLVWLVAIIALVKTHFSGLVFDLRKDRLYFPTLLFRRSVCLSAIRDANAQYLHRSFRMANAASYGGDLGSDSNVKLPIYAANISGDFGVRQVKFWSKKRRDQFLSYLRLLVPDAHITRWW